MQMRRIEQVCYKQCELIKMKKRNEPGYCTPSDRLHDTISSKVRRLKDLLNGCKVHNVERKSDEGEGYSKQYLK